MKNLTIRPFAIADSEEVIAIWQACGLTVPWNDPHKDIARKMEVNPELFLVAEVDGRIAGTVMGGYEGHRGWINYLAVAPDFQRQRIGVALMQEVEAKLQALGCPKINLQVRPDNNTVLAFYRGLGYAIEERVSLGKRLD